MITSLSCRIIRIILAFSYYPAYTVTISWVLRSYSTTRTSLCTFPGRGPSCAFFAAGWSRAVAAGLAQGAAEMFVHHRADVSLEVGEEDASWADVLSLRWLLLLGRAVLLLYSGRGMAGERVPSAYGFFLHFRIKSQFLKENKCCQFELLCLFLLLCTWTWTFNCSILFNPVPFSVYVTNIGKDHFKTIRTGYK